MKSSLLVLLIIAIGGAVLVGSACAQSPQNPDAQAAKKKFTSQLRNRIAKDQKTRLAIIRYRKRKNVNPEKLRKLFEEASIVDGDNLTWLKSHIQKFGWPAISAIGRRPAEEFFILVLHADRAPEFQQKCLDLMAKMPDGEWSPKDHKKLEERIELLKGK